MIACYEQCTVRERGRGFAARNHGKPSTKTPDGVALALRNILLQPQKQPLALNLRKERPITSVVQHELSVSIMFFMKSLNNIRDSIIFIGFLIVVFWLILITF